MMIDNAEYRNKITNLQYGYGHVSNFNNLYVIALAKHRSLKQYKKILIKHKKKIKIFTKKYTKMCNAHLGLRNDN